MKSIVIISALIFSFIIVNAQKNPATELAGKIAQRMKDTLNLSDAQKVQVYDINIRLHDQKTALRNQYAGNSLLNTKIQSVENTRDSLYRTVLTQAQFLLYSQKKRTLMSSH